MTDYFTRYEPKSARSTSEVDPSWLEETNLGPLSPKLVDRIQEEEKMCLPDADADGLREVSVATLERIGGTNNPLPLATFFYDKKPQQPKNNRTSHLPDSLRKPTLNHDIEGSRRFFATRLWNSRNPLKDGAPLTANHLSASLIHPGISMGTAGDIENPSGHSLRSDGRLRTNCVGHATLAHSDWKGLEARHHLTFHYITLAEQERNPSSVNPLDAGNNFLRNHSISQMPLSGMRPFGIVHTPQGPAPDYPESLTDSDHMILLISDQKGHHLIVDNNQTQYFESENPLQEIKNRIYRDTPFFYQSDTPSGPKIKF